MEYVKFKDVIINSQYGYTATETSQTEGTYKYLRITDIVPYYVNFDTVPFCKITEKDVSKYIVKEGDILIARTGATTGYNYVVPSGISNTVYASYLIRFIVDKKLVLPLFMKYVLKTQSYYGFINNYIGGSAQPGMNAKVFTKFNIPKLSLVTQQKIASILSSYDRLIENNTRRIRLLEQMAENLYKEWFVRFRFPEHENVEMVNGLPKGWNKEELGNIADVCMGSSPKSEYYNDEKKGLPFHQGVGSFGERFVLDNTYSTSYSQIANPMSILFSVRAPVGRLNYTRNRIAIGRGVAAINHKEGMQSLLFYTLKAKFFKEDIVGNGAIFSSITKKELLKLKLIVPIKELRVVFNNKINKIDREIDIQYKQNQLLTRQRDLLLPRLMSGKLEVKS